MNHTDQSTKQEEVLFTSHDGKDIKVGDPFWYFEFNKESYSYIKQKNQADNSDQPNGKKYFSSIDAIEEYALLIEPILSIHDLLTWQNEDAEITNCRVEDLLKLVRQKYFKN